MSSRQVGFVLNGAARVSRFKSSSCGGDDSVDLLRISSSRDSSSAFCSYLSARVTSQPALFVVSTDSSIGSLTGLDAGAVLSSGTEQTQVNGLY